MFFFFNDTATTEIYTLSLHDALPIYTYAVGLQAFIYGFPYVYMAQVRYAWTTQPRNPERSEEHTSELQSRQYLVCRLLLEKKNTSRHQASHGQIAPQITSHNSIHSNL